MDLTQRIKALAQLGEELQNQPEEEIQQWETQAALFNQWFTPDNVRLAINGVINYLDESALQNWVNDYDLQSVDSKDVGIVMAGNIPLVGFHDLLSTLIAGHRAHIKMSSDDNYLLKCVLGKLFSINPAFENLVFFPDKLTGMDAVIATGGDNTARYFNYYFRDIPHIIRKNRTSLAILDGNETEEDFKALGKDLFQYFGLGCRNVSKLLVPKGYKFDAFYEGIDNWKDIIHHHKYRNNYDYRKSILLVNRNEHLDNGFLMLQENTAFVSPISVVYYAYYDSQEDLKNKLDLAKEKLQCVVSRENTNNGFVQFGMAQSPTLKDYADGVDTMKFLTAL